MTLLNRILAEKRTFVTVVGAILVVDIALYALAIYPWLTKVSQSESRTSTAESQIEQVRTAFSAATTVSDNTLLADNELERFYREILPRDLAGARLILSPFLDRLAEESDLVLIHLHVLKHIAPEAGLLRRRLLSLPIYPGLSDLEIEYVIKYVLEYAEEIN